MSKLLLTRQELQCELINAATGGLLAVAKKYNVSRPVIARLCNIHNISSKYFFEQRIPSKESLENDFKNKLTMEQMCVQYNTFPKELKNWCKQRNVDLVYNRNKRIKNIPSKTDLEQRVTHLKQSFKQISQDLNVSDVTVGMWCKKYQISPIHKPFFGTSNIEKLLKEELNKSLPFSNKRKFLKLSDNKTGDIDLFNEDNNVGVEVNGVYWHSEERVGKLYHKNKSDAAIKQNITLLHFWDYEIKNKFDIVVSLILSKCNLNKETYFARKLKIIEDHKNVRQFLKENHLNGAPSNIKKSFSLVSDDKIICTLTLSSHHRKQLNANDIVLSRLCFKRYTSVTGGTQRLFKSCLNYLQNTNYNNIISWSDNRWTLGEVYIKLGFISTKVYPPDYFYWKGDKVFSKQSKMKSLTGCPLDKTESKWMKECGYRRVYDCGKTKWVFNLPK